MREEGLEPSRVAPRDPKSRASASSATLATEAIVGASQKAINLPLVNPNGPASYLPIYD